VQLALADHTFSEKLRGALLHEPAFHGWRVDCCLQAPDVAQPGVIVVDMDALDRVGSDIPHPERVVLITHRDPEQLARAWDAGIVSVIYEDEPLSTAMLAVMAARFRAAPHPH
jgi:DNA-binding NarL/FixJ family response regulator